MDRPATAGASRKRLLIVGPLVILSIVWISFAFFRLSAAEASVSRERLIIGTVERGEFVRDVTATGRVVAAISPTLYSTAAGTVTFEVKSGTSVEKDQVLAVIDSPEIGNLLQQEESVLQHLKIDDGRELIQSKIKQLQNAKTIDLAKIRLAAADREKRRAESAWERKAINAIDFEKAHDELENAALEYEHAKADAGLSKESMSFEIRTRALAVERQQLRVDNLKREVDELSVRSPVDGVVGNLLVDQKATVAENQAVLSVVDLTVFEVEIRIAESFADDLTIGMITENRIDGKMWEGRLVAISPEIVNNQVICRVSFSGERPESLRANQRVSTRVVLERRDDVLMLKRGQFVSETGGRIAYKIRDGIAYRTALGIGARSISHIEILEGAAEGEQIIVSSIAAFKNSETVLITQ